ncbi:MAG: acyltransferase family protein [Lachnospiraceae bacterium]|nr:acyltransferase family protein [Lachnospiraceae bacterium]
MSIKKSKNILGIFSILIMLHHLGQKISAPWLPSGIRVHGLEPFVPIGYLLVAFFFFCSGYGLVKSMRSKENYFKGFLVKRLNRILMVFVFTEVIWFIVRVLNGALSLPLNPYSWFIYTIIILYFGFFLFYRKEKKYSLLLMALWILGYSIICYILVKGNWWFNASPVFLLGLYFADREIKPKSVHFALLSLIFSATFALSEFADPIYSAIGMSNYGLLNFLKVILQIVACSCFSLLIYAICVKTTKPAKEAPAELSGGTSETKDATGKVPAEGKLQKVLSFFGSMTLEFYMIHGLFVQVFGHHFLDDSIAPVMHINNIVLYVIVVFAVSTASAFVLKKACDLLVYLYIRSAGFRKFTHDIKKFILVVAGIFVLVTVLFAFNRSGSSEDAQAKIKEFRDKYITTVDVNGTDVAVYMTGEGEHTIVILSSDMFPCSTVHLKPTADMLASTYRVVVIDFPGTGYSEDCEDERTSDFYADIIKGTLDGLNIKDNIVLMPHVISGLYAYKYIEKYPEGVVAMIGLDSAVPEVGPRLLGGTYSSTDEYSWYMDRYMNIMGLERIIESKLGYVSTPPYDQIFIRSSHVEYIPVMEEMFITNYHQGAHLEEQRYSYKNCLSVMDFTLPEDLPAVFLVTNSIKEGKPYGVDWMAEYNNMITNSQIQSVRHLSGDPYILYYDRGLIKMVVDSFMTNLK